MLSIQKLKKYVDFFSKVYYNALIDANDPLLWGITHKRTDSFLCNLIKTALAGANLHIRNAVRTRSENELSAIKML